LNANEVYRSQRYLLNPVTSVRPITSNILLTELEELSIVIKSSKMKNQWEKNVSTLKSGLLALLKVVETYEKMESADECIDPASPDHADQLGKLLKEVVASAIPISQELERAVAKVTGLTAPRKSEEIKFCQSADVPTVVDEEMVTVKDGNATQESLILMNVATTALEKSDVEQNGKNPSMEESFVTPIIATSVVQKEDDNKTQQVEVSEQFDVPLEAIGQYVIGKKYMNVHRLQEVYNVIVKTPPLGGTEIMVKGFAKDVAAAKSDIIKNIPSCILTESIEKRFHGVIIGSQGTVIKGLRKDYNVKVDLLEREERIVIAGEKDDCKNVLGVIRSIVARKEKFDAFLVKNRTHV